MFEAGRIDLLDYDYEETNIFQDPSSSTDYRYVRSEFEKSGITVEPDEDIAAYFISGKQMLFYGICKDEDEAVEDMIERTVRKYIESGSENEIPFMTGIRSIPLTEIDNVPEDVCGDYILSIEDEEVIWVICDGIIYYFPGNYEHFVSLGILEKY